MKMILKPLYIKPRDLSPIAKPEQASEKKTVSFSWCADVLFLNTGAQVT